MSRLENDVQTQEQLDNELRRLRDESPLECDRYFGRKLSDHVNADGHVDLGTLPGRLVRSCLFDMYELIRDAMAPVADFRTHMFFITRNFVERIDGQRLVPANVRRTYDGLDEFQPQTAYLNNWSAAPTEADFSRALSEVTAKSSHSGFVRSFRCFTESYFQPTGSFVVQFPNELVDDFRISRLTDYASKRLSVPTDWHKQESLDGSIVAFCKFIAAKYIAHNPNEAPGSRQLFLMAVGSHALPWRRNAQAAVSDGSELSSFLQSSWIVLSVSAKDSGKLLLSKLARVLPRLDNSMTCCLVFNQVNGQDALIENLKTEKGSYNKLRRLVETAGEQFEEFKLKISEVFVDVIASHHIAARLAHDLHSTVLSRVNDTFESAAQSGLMLDCVHDDIRFRRAFRGPDRLQYANDLEARLDSALGTLRAKAKKRFLGNKPVDEETIKSLKYFVYRAFAPGEIEREGVVSIGMLRSALLWQFPGDFLDDEKILLRFAPNKRIASVINRPADFLACLAHTISLWLAPKEDEVHRITHEHSDKAGVGKSCLLLSCRDSDRPINMESMVSLRDAVKNGGSGGSLTKSLLDLRGTCLSGVVEVALVPYPHKGESAEAASVSAGGLRLKWPMHADEHYRCEITLLWRVSTETAGGYEKSVELSFPT